MAYENEDGSLSLLFDQAVVENMQPEDMYQLIHSQSKGFRLPGWEEERLQQFQELKAMYAGVTEEDLVENLRYFLERVIPVCEEENIKMGIHPDDPPWEILVCQESLKFSGFKTDPFLGGLTSKWDYILYRFPRCGPDE